MQLTGKAETDFRSWLDNNRGSVGFIQMEPSNVNVEFDDLDYDLEDRIILDWLDSVGLYINISPFYDRSGKYVRGFEAELLVESTGDVFEITNAGDVFEDRYTAIRDSILKADETYNSREL